jgi:hypothetical protein
MIHMQSFTSSGVSPRCLEPWLRSKYSRYLEFDASELPSSMAFSRASSAIRSSKLLTAHCLSPAHTTSIFPHQVEIMVDFPVVQLHNALDVSRTTPHRHQHTDVTIVRKSYLAERSLLPPQSYQGRHTHIMYSYEYILFPNSHMPMMIHAIIRGRPLVLLRRLIPHFLPLLQHPVWTPELFDC